MHLNYWPELGGHLFHARESCSKRYKQVLFITNPLSASLTVSFIWSVFSVFDSLSLSSSDHSVCPKFTGAVVAKVNFRLLFSESSYKGFLHELSFWS